MHDILPIGIAIADLRPTQMTVGYREVEEKRRHWHAADAEGRARLLRRHVLPAVIGPKRRPYIVDHHHFARALLMEKAGPVAVYVLADLSHLPKAEFWTFLDNSAWCHAYDADGRRCALSAIPRKLGALKDDPFRSLVGALIRGGGIAKSGKPFAEFLWADYLRRRFARSALDEDFAGAVKQALKIVGHHDASSLPGWCGKDAGGL